MPDIADPTVEEFEVESSRRRVPVRAIVLGLVVAVVAVWITAAVATDRDPEETVEAYLDAVAEKDVEGALALVSRYGYGVPYGDRATFLTADAIRDDWWVVSVTEIDREYRTEARVEAVIAGPGGTSKGEFTVQEIDDEWLLDDPFLEVRFPASPLSYIHVNDKIAPRSAEDGIQRYALFPGTYRFYGSVPDVVDTARTDVVAVFPRAEDSSDDWAEIVPANLTAGADVVAKAQDAIKRLVDDCATFTTTSPANCPFATDGQIDTPAGARVTRLHGLTWKVKSYPTITLADDRADELSQGFALHTEKPGTVTLSGSGVDTDDKRTSFTVTCDIDLTGYLTTVTADGAVAVHGSPARRQAAPDAFNTCRRNS
ncbi:hypothetical protein [Actinophytocola sp. NPDC049390]|uniref:hypothetical protein n=1 Tax=Actinophytocola sp. NPDC049390 TaxID=3363894 RepID=UPI003795BE0B